MLAKKLISVVIPVYNGERYIKACLDSVLNQDLDNRFDLEVIVLDNVSTDRTFEIVSTFLDPCVRLARNEIHLSAGENWNAVSHLAKGDFVKLLPADDTLEPDCLLSQVTAMSSYPGTGMVASSRRLVSDSGTRLPVLFGNLSLTGGHSGRAAIRHSIVNGANVFGEPGSIMFDGNVFRNNLPWSPESAYVIDLEFYFRVLSGSNYFGLASRHATFRLSSKSWSRSLRGSQTRQLSSLLLETSERLALNLSIAEEKRSQLKIVFRTFLRSCLVSLVGLLDKGNNV